MPAPRKVLIMGAAGRDFHNFNVRYRGDRSRRVVAFTAFQIPNIEGRTYPASLAGRGYPRGIPIFAESDLPRLIRELKADEVVFSYSDVSHEEVMHRASLANAAGADFLLLGSRATSLKSRKPVAAVCAVRTGCGKSQTSRALAQLLRARGLKVAVVRHPMPYGDLEAQRKQRFSSLADLDLHRCTIEEREEYESHIQRGQVVFAGVDYAEILKSAEKEADVILWDGGNNDIPFYVPDLHVVVADPLRAGHELRYHPGETNLRMAHAVLISKIGTAEPAAVAEVERNVRAINPRAAVIKADSEVSVSDPSAIKGKRVLVVEDGPTLTHGGMAFGAGHVAARRWGAREIVDPRPYAVGSIKRVFEKYPHVREVLPAMGYGEKQVRELEATIDAVPCDLVLVGTPFDLGRIVKSRHPLMRVTYELDEAGTRALGKLLERLPKGL